MDMNLGKITGAEKISKEIVAYNIVKLYFEEIARLGYKRKLDLDAIITAYFYVLGKLEDKQLENEVSKQPAFVVEAAKELEKAYEKERK